MFLYSLDGATSRTGVDIIFLRYLHEENQTCTIYGMCIVHIMFEVTLIMNNYLSKRCLTLVAFANS
jgi:hypothetical protein